MDGSRRFTVSEYHKLIECGVLTENDRIELLEGLLIEKEPHDPAHDGTLQRVNKAVRLAVPIGWQVRVQMSVTLADSEPEPDAAVVRDEPGEYVSRHPGPADLGIVIEVVNSTFHPARTDKLRIYARAGLPVYWIVNVVDGQVEVYEQPSGPTADPGYGTSRVYRKGDAVPLVLDGIVVGTMLVADLLP